MMRSPSPFDCCTAGLNPLPLSSMRSRPRSPSQRKFDLHLARRAMLRGIGHRFLRDAIQVQGIHRFESAIERVVRLAAHVDVKHRGQAPRQLFEREGQAAAIEGHGRQAARQRARGEDGVVDQQRDFLDRRRQAPALRARRDSRDRAAAARCR